MMSDVRCMIVYSFIIPHKNCPVLLNRCLDSIPIRDDVQIIVVDDNSDVDKKLTLSRQDILKCFCEVSQIYVNKARRKIKPVDC